MAFKIIAVVISLSMLMIITISSNKSNTSLNSKEDEATVPLYISSTKDKLVDFLLEERKSQFSFIQEDEHSSHSYRNLLQEMTRHSKTGRVLNTKDIYLTPNAGDSKQIMFRQIYIWLPITLGLILYFTILALVEMPIQKSSILYAKYGTSKQNQVLQ